MIFLQIFDWTKRTLTPQHPSSDPAILKRTTLSNVDEWKRNMEPTCKCSMRSANLVGRANLGHLVSRITAFLEWVTIVNQFHRTIYTTSCHHWWHWSTTWIRFLSLLLPVCVQRGNPCTLTVFEKRFIPLIPQITSHSPTCCEQCLLSDGVPTLAGSGITYQNKNYTILYSVTRNVIQFHHVSL